jgi:sugar fermentation stimulation protein A
VPELAGYERIRREVRYGENSRVDLVLESGDERCFVEVKNAHLMRAPGVAEFPDSVTARGARHLRELAKLSAEGVRAVVLFVVQRSDAHRFTVAGDIDPGFHEAARAARTAGVEVLCYGCALSPEQIVLDKALPVAV